RHMPRGSVLRLPREISPSRKARAALSRRGLAISTPSSAVQSRREFSCRSYFRVRKAGRHRRLWQSRLARAHLSFSARQASRRAPDWLPHVVALEDVVANAPLQLAQTERAEM